MFLVTIVGPFTKWGIDFTTCHLASARGNRYIIIAVDYFTKWFEAMPMFNNDGETITLFIFNQIIARFDIPKEIVTDHGSHFQKKMMSELTSNLGLRQEHSSPYYPQKNGQVEVVNKSLKNILQRTINSAKSNWHLMMYSKL
jgi:transposase InsO family protein